MRQQLEKERQELERQREENESRLKRELAVSQQTASMDVPANSSGNQVSVEVPNNILEVSGRDKWVLSLGVGEWVWQSGSWDEDEWVRPNGYGLLREKWVCQATRGEWVWLVRGAWGCGGWHGDSVGVSWVCVGC